MRKPFKIALISTGAALMLATAGGSAYAVVQSGSHAVAARPAPHITVPVPTPPAAKTKAPAKRVHAPASQAPQAAAPAQPAPAAPHLTNATAVVAQFYQDITSRDYPDAWNLGGKYIGGQDYNGWVAGYATTASIDLATYGQWSDGTVWASLNATQADGTIKYYSGTYTVAGGSIVSAHITQQEPSYEPASSSSCGGITLGADTSCAFAQNVKQAYDARIGSGSGTITAYSPVTGKTYTEYCTETGTLVSAVGVGNDTSATFYAG